MQPTTTNQHGASLLRSHQHGYREDECLDDDCVHFCSNLSSGSSERALECSPNEFSLDMNQVVDAFRPSGLIGLTAGPSGSIFPNPPPAAGGDLRQLGCTTTYPGINDTKLLIYPRLVDRVERYFQSLPPTRPGWTWTVTRERSFSEVTTQSNESARQTDSATANSASGTELSVSCTSRPASPRETPSEVTIMPNTVLDPIAEIGYMRQFPSSVVPFGPSRYLNYPQGMTNENGGNYLGTMGAASNQVADLPDHLNTCIWIEGAPADITYFELLRNVRNCGKIFSLHINPPRDRHYTAAAKIAFCTRSGAERFFGQAQSVVGIKIRGKRLCVRWNRNKYRENYNRTESRVLRISGPEHFVNHDTLMRYFSRLFYFNLIRADEITPGEMIWEFGSILAQAHSAKQAIEREPAMRESVRVRYEKDPCE